MRHPGLIAKKVIVQGKRGNHFPRTYWVLPSFGQAVRLSKARRATEKMELPAESSRASLERWFKEHGHDIGAGGAKLLSHFFKKPDGTPLSGDDFERMLGNPGTRRVPIMEYKTNEHGAKIKNADTGEYEVQPVLDKGGKVQYRDVAFRMEITKMGITGDRMEVAANIMNAGPPAEAIGVVSRVFRKVEGMTFVDHDLLKIDPIYGGAGLGSTIIKNQLTTYPELGVKEVWVNTAWVGRYTWATMGFQMEDIARRQNARDFETFAQELVKGGGKEYFRDGTTPILRPDKVPYTARELVALYNWNGPSWRAASAELPVWDEAQGKVTTRKLGKEFLLHGRTDGWSGSIPLEDGNPAYERIKGYLGIEDYKKKADRLRNEASEYTFQANLALSDDDLAGAGVARAKARALEQEAANLLQREADSSAIRAARAQAYRAHSEREAAEEKRAIIKAAQGLSRPLPLISPFESLNSVGLPYDMAERLKKVNAEATDYTAPPAHQRAAVAERDLIRAEGRLAEIEADLRKPPKRDENRDELTFEREVAEIKRDQLRKTWMELQRAADEVPRTGSAPVRTAQQDKEEDKARIERNIQGAKAEVSLRGGRVEELEMNNAPPAKIRNARAQYEEALATLGRIRALASGEPFDAAEEQEMRQQQKGIEASRKLGQGIQALARVRRR